MSDTIFSEYEFFSTKDLMLTYFIREMPKDKMKILKFSSLCIEHFNLFEK